MKTNEQEIPGLITYTLTKNDDERGYFKEAYSEKNHAQPDFSIRQINHGHNARRGVTRGIHAEPWDKFIWLTRGKVFAAFVDLRDGENFGTVATMILDDSMAVFVPAGVGNSYQTLRNNTDYCYAVSGLWESGVKYSAVSLADRRLKIPWPIPLSEAILSVKDRNNPTLRKLKIEQALKLKEVG